MCGISGRIGINVVPKLIDDLKVLEYRGYDAAGIGIVKHGKISVTKVKGSVSKLKLNTDTTFGIAHTRWATHGKVSKVNAHPHVSKNGKWAIVHNGIIENADELKKELAGVEFKSQTDSEVIAQLLGKYGNGVTAISKVSKMLKGSFAVVAINVDFPDTLFVMRRFSPLYLYRDKDKVIASSDTLTFDKVKYVELKDGDYGYVTMQDTYLWDENDSRVTRSELVLDIPKINLPDRYFKHHMLKEIFDTPTCINNIIEYYKNWTLDVDLSKYVNIKLIGCGTAYHTAVMGARFLQELTGKECSAYIANEFENEHLPINKKTLYIFVSQSGETADTLKCMYLLKSKRCKLIVITNKPNSTMSKVAHVVLPMLAGTEIAVASTKAYTCGVAVLYLMAHYFKFGNTDKAIVKLIKLKKYIVQLLENKFDDVNKIYKLKSCFFVGKGYDYITAMEGNLKLKEITYINCQAFASGELKHGTLALIDKKSVVFAINTNSELSDALMNNINEIKARGGKVIILNSVKGVKGDINFKHIDTKLDGLLIMVYLQQLAYYTSVRKKINPDKPRNLAKSVTVV